MPASIEGQNGSGALWAVCCRIAEFDLCEQDAWLLVQEYNARAVPEWSEKDLRRHLARAAEAVDAGGTRGCRNRDASAWQAPATDIDWANFLNEGTSQQAAAPTTPAPAAPAAAAATAPAPPKPPALRAMTVRELVSRHPALRRPIIHGLLRDGETMNVIAASKAGKSWLATDLAIAVATGRPWLGHDTERGRVLAIDNELHAETSAYRIPRVAEARGVPFDDFADGVDVVNLRGRLADLNTLGASLLSTYKPGALRLVVLDAFYRATPTGIDENSNADITSLYNTIDSVALRLGCAFVLVHHASKGNQSGKGIVDVGAGAGSQSRAADTHVVLRPHAEPNAVVLDAVARSWPPPAPRCLYWDWPVFLPATDLDPTDLRPERPSRRKATAQDTSQQAVVERWTYQRFAEAFAGPSPLPKTALLARAADAGLSDRQTQQLFRLATGAGLLHEWPRAGKAKKGFATVPPPLTP